MHHPLSLKTLPPPEPRSLHSQGSALPLIQDALEKNDSQYHVPSTPGTVPTVAGYLVLLTASTMGRTVPVSQEGVEERSGAVIKCLTL